MQRKAPSMGKTLAIIALTAVLLSAMGGSTKLAGQGDEGLTIVVTFPFIKGDVELIATCEGDSVLSLVPPGVDPHDYQLTPKDLQVLASADVIISTAHTHFETEIKNMKLSGELKGILIEIPSIENITLLRIPSSGTVNYHGMLFHGDNYAVFVRYLAKVLESLRPECAHEYENSVDNVLDRIGNISSFKPLKGVNVVIDSPTIQYLAAWLGANVSHIVMVEHDVPLTPGDIDKVESILASYGQNAMVLVLEDSPARNILEDLASNYGAGLVTVSNPLVYPDSIIQYLETVVSALTAPQTSGTEASAHDKIDIVSILAVSMFLIGVVLIVYLRSRR